MTTVVKKEQTEIKTQDKFRISVLKHFEGSGQNALLQADALKNAMDNRKFEIEHYWHRATYFWVFIGIVWAAFGNVLFETSILDTKEFVFTNSQISILYFISNVGLCVSLAWYLVNKGSKFWQENWENQIRVLERGIIGPSYEMVIGKSTKGFFLLNSGKYSVSKVNQVISLYNFILWTVINGWLLALVTPKGEPLWNPENYVTTSITILVLVCLFCCRSSLKHTSLEFIRQPNDGDDHLG